MILSIGNLFPFACMPAAQWNSYASSTEEQQIQGSCQPPGAALPTCAKHQQHLLLTSILGQLLRGSAAQAWWPTQVAPGGSCMHGARLMQKALFLELFVLGFCQRILPYFIIAHLWPMIASISATVLQIMHWQGVYFRNQNVA